MKIDVLPVRDGFVYMGITSMTNPYNEAQPVWCAGCPSACPSITELKSKLVYGGIEAGD
jgi:hypothetical protein